MRDSLVTLLAELRRVAPYLEQPEARGAAETEQAIVRFVEAYIAASELETAALSRGLDPAHERGIVWLAWRLAEDPVNRPQPNLIRTGW